MVTSGWTIPSALADFHSIESALRGRRAAVFLDYDGTLTPIVDTPGQAALSDEMRDALRELGCVCSIAIVSGRARTDVQERVRLDRLFYAGAHGFDIVGPAGSGIRREVGREVLPVMEALHQRLCAALAHVPGLLLETKGYSVAVHYRLADEAAAPGVEAVVDDLLKDQSALRKTHGKKVFEIRPRLDWHKGRAVEWILGALGLDHAPVYLGDDATDEDGFRAVAAAGAGILVADRPRATAAGYRLKDHLEVGRFLRRLARTLHAPA